MKQINKPDYNREADCFASLLIGFKYYHKNLYNVYGKVLKQMIKFEEVTYKNFGRCISMSNGIVELLATLDFGPRIIRFSKINGENVMFEDINRSLNKDESADLFAEKFGKELGTWRIYGGHRLWASPETFPRTYYPDNEPVEYKTEGNKLTLTPPPQRYNQQQMKIEIIMSVDSGRVDLYHTITNLSPWPQKFSPWCLSVLGQNGTEIVPVPTRSTGLLHNRKITLWDYTKMNDQRVHWGDKYIFLTQDPNAECPLKFGIDSQHGWAAYFIHGDVMLKKFDVIEGAEYPDDGMSFETYTSDLFLEMESLGEYKEVESGDSISHHESWELIPDLAFPGINETAVEALLINHVK